MRTSSQMSDTEQAALKKALESNFEVMTVDMEKLEEEEFDLDWRDELEDCWAYRKGFD